MKILFIDDDKAPIRYYLSELRDAGFDVTHCRNPDETLEILHKEGCIFRLILLDSAMPPGRCYAEADTEEGLTTGRYLFEDIRKVCPEIPILILTNFAGLDWIYKACASANVGEVRKLDVMPVDLVQKVRKMIK
jgi:CheY-like chemotaxis protein